MLGWSQHTSQNSRLLLICCLLACQQWPPLPPSDVLPGPRQHYPSQLSTLISSDNLHPSGELHHGGGGARLSTWHGQEHALGLSHETGQSPRHSQPASSTLFWEKATMCVLFMNEVHVAQAPLTIPLVVKLAKGTSFLVLNPRAWVPHMCFKLLTPQGGYLNLCNPPFLCPLLEVHIPTWSLLFPSYLTLSRYFFTAFFV